MILYEVRVSPRRPSSATSPQTLAKNGNLLSQKVVGDKTKNRKEDGVPKKVEPSPSSVRTWLPMPIFYSSIL